MTNTIVTKGTTFKDIARDKVYVAVKVRDPWVAAAIQSWEVHAIEIGDMNKVNPKVQQFELLITPIVLCGGTCATIRHLNPDQYEIIEHEGDEIRLVTTTSVVYTFEKAVAFEDRSLD